MFKFTKPALSRIVNAIEGTDYKGIFVDIKKSGCTGYRYVLQYVDTVDAEWSKSTSDGIDIYCDKTQYFINTTIDYKSDIFKEGFEFVNPNESAQCGCGESVNFDIPSLRV
jgi:iron-sulfur cluster assembly accessory protein